VAIVSHISRELVRGFAGCVDFYYWRGKAIARKWPQHSRIPATVAQAAAREVFKLSRKNLKFFSPEVREAWKLLYWGKNENWLDYYTAMYISFWKRNAALAPVIYSYRVVISEIL
jgi:hypothetical protein